MRSDSNDLAENETYWTVQNAISLVPAFLDMTLEGARVQWL